MEKYINIYNYRYKGRYKALLAITQTDSLVDKCVYWRTDRMGDRHVLENPIKDWEINKEI